MGRYNVTPTKTNLIKLKREHQFAREGHELLSQKRDILITELTRLIDKTEDLEKKVEEELGEAYKALELAIISMGKGQLFSISRAVNIKSFLNIKDRKVMGVNIPVVDTRFEDIPPYYDFSNTSFWIDETILAFKKVLMQIGKLAEMKVSVLKLCREVNKTIRRVNALEKICLPDYESSISWVQDVLEEGEREAFFIRKLIKKYKEKKGDKFE